MKLNETTNKRILLSPLNWGMGHLSRSIGLIRLLIVQQNEVLIACNEIQKSVFKSYFPNIQIILHEGYPFEFSGDGNFANDLFQNRKKLLPRFVEEQKEVKALIDEHKIDLVISDQRYGFYSTKVPSVFITHQIHLSLKWYQFFAGWLNTRLLKNFNHIWCMDSPTHDLAGKLSKPVANVPVDYIGFFSRFENTPAQPDSIDKLFVVSGPEPYAEQFFNEILDYCTETNQAAVCLSPHQYNLTKAIPENLDLVVANDWKEHDSLFYQSGTIISRAGYSTLMDLKILNKKAILVPTPGQSEQIYLSELHKEHSAWKFIKSLADLKTI